MVIAGAPAFTFKKFLNGVSIGSSAVAEEEENFVKEVEVYIIIIIEIFILRRNIHFVFLFFVITHFSLKKTKSYFLDNSSFTWCSLIFSP